MMSRIVKIGLLGLVLAFAGLVSYTPPASAETRTFSAPTIRGGYRLDWCLYWTRACGRPAADEYCRRRGFRHAVRFAQAPNIGDRIPTRIITSGRICNRHFCDGFRYITCARPGGVGPGPVSSRVFHAPRVGGGYRLDWCKYWKRDCGRPAADEFCRRRGFRHAADFTQATDIGHRTPTRIITSGRICDRRFCDGFRYIRCVGRR